MNARKVAQRWYRQAAHDLEMARRNRTIEGYNVAAFLAHQAVEKVLKAAFALEGKPIPRTHNLDDIASQLGLPDELQDALLDLMSDYAVARYPDVAGTVPYELYSDDIAATKIEIAERIFDYFERRWGTL
ncbi:MAG: HEPN domain-containing protein [Fimbriimonadales bacterium]